MILIGLNCMVFMTVKFYFSAGNDMGILVSFILFNFLFRWYILPSFIMFKFKLILKMKMTFGGLIGIFAIIALNCNTCMKL